VRAVGLYRSGLLDYGERRLWVIAPPPPRETAAALPAAELVQGDPQQATERMRAGGWLVLSKAIAEEHPLHIGEAFMLLAPDPKRFRLAGLSTNLGWAPGAIIMNAKDYARVWGSEDASAYSVMLAPGFPPAWGACEIEQALGTHSGLAMQSAQAHAAQQRALSREALVRLSQIATLILVAAVLAMAAGDGRPAVAAPPTPGEAQAGGLSPHRAVAHDLAGESAAARGRLLTGAIFGLYGQQLADRALVNVVNFPVVYSVTAVMALESLALVNAAALAILAIPLLRHLCAGGPCAAGLRSHQVLRLNSKRKCLHQPPVRTSTPSI
jgi:putative ABC transport system permease protein